MRYLLPGVVLCAAALPGQWRQLSPTQAPTPRQGHAMVHDSGSGDTWLFGGRDAQGPRADTWRWNGRDWRPVATTIAPSPRARHGMAWDSARDVAVLFGGDPLSAETWEFDGVTWTRRMPANAPLPRHSHVLEYDEQRQRTVLFGGFAGSVALGDTWEWDGSDWTPVNTAIAPSPRGACAAEYDRRSRGIVLFGGADAPNGNRLGGTWVHDGTDWRLESLAGPTPRAGAAMADDRNGRHVLMFGGDDGAGMDETWMWLGVQWSRLRIPAPSGRRGHAMAHDPARGVTLLFGGSTGGGETWEHVRPLQGFLAPQAFFETFGAGCPANPPLLRAVSGSLPALSSTFSVEVFPARFFTATFGALGFSSTFAGGAPLPQSLAPLGFPSGCMQLIDPTALVFLPAPQNVARWNLPIPNSPGLAGTAFYLQAVQLDTVSAAPSAVTNAGEGRIGADVTPRQITETFDNNQQQDPEASSGPWGGGTLQPGLLGGDGRHGSFDPALGTQVAPNVYEWDTDSTTIPAGRTLTARAETITDGRFSFSDFAIPAGTTVRFTGRSPLVLRVRGNARIDGVLQANGAEMTGFRARERFNTALLPGQPGGLGGPGGGRGGKGGDRCSGNGPTIVSGVNTNDGQPGEDVRLPAGHAYAGMQAGTGGQGSGLFPASGLNGAVVYNISFGAFSGMMAAGGGGGGFATPGQQGVVVSVPPPSLGQQPFPGPSTVPGAAFSLFPMPAGVSSLDHFMAGGSGGGGGGSHPFLAIILAYPDTWRAGAGGSGGGGVVAVRAGNDVFVLGAVEAKGGDGFLFSDTNMGIPAPGGGGSGGTVLLQAGRSLLVQGALDTSGGPGSSTGNIVPASNNGVSQGGAGSPGLVRVESGGSRMLTGATVVPPLGPNGQAMLQDRDALVGARSAWYSTGALGVPSYLRYELDATVNGVPVTFSDDPAVGMPASQPGLPVRIRFQGTRGDLATGVADPTRAGPWRDSVVMLPVDRAVFFRFDIVFDKSVALSVSVDEVRVLVR